MRKWTLFFVMILCSCATEKIYQRKTAFNPSDYEPYNKPGNATITGQAYATLRGGSARYAAGKTVTLVPATSYTAEWIGQISQSKAAIAPADERFLKYEKQCLADDLGRFTFTGLPAGRYYLACPRFWDARPNIGVIESIPRTGSALTMPVELKDGEFKEVTLSP